ncbi:hypothetical protein PR048_027571 [Dryococelus australis]|uniref:Uncharacterized protein n=1 Tax=Dryococelus australis TaxID=614101 RepID=A0ABQ9GGW4_9NEOP|nr:hypothetical protein PR048_027571 [Dryococelus australis]
MVFHLVTVLEACPYFCVTTKHAEYSRVHRCHSTCQRVQEIRARLRGGPEVNDPTPVAFYGFERAEPTARSAPPTLVYLLSLSISLSLVQVTTATSSPLGLTEGYPTDVLSEPAREADPLSPAYTVCDPSRGHKFLFQVNITQGVPSVHRQHWVREARSAARTPETSKAVSLAYCRRAAPGRVGMSATYRVNRRELNKDPCGIPAVMEKEEEKVSETQTNKAPYEGGHPDPAVVQTISCQDGGSTEIHVDHFPKHRVRWRTGSTQDVDPAWCSHGVSEEISAALNNEALRADEGEASYGAAPECKGGGMGEPRESPSTSGIARHDSLMLKSEGDPTRNRARGETAACDGDPVACFVGGCASGLRQAPWTTWLAFFDFLSFPPPSPTLPPPGPNLICTAQRYDGNIARFARRSDEALGVRVTVARIAPSLLDLASRPDESPAGKTSCLLSALSVEAMKQTLKCPKSANSTVDLLKRLHPNQKIFTEYFSSLHSTIEQRFPLMNNELRWPGGLPRRRSEAQWPIKLASPKTFPTRQIKPLIQGVVYMTFRTSKVDFSKIFLYGHL